MTSAGLPELPDRLLTIQDAADYLNVPVRWVQDAVRQRRVRCTRIGKHVRFAPEHLVELIAAGEQPTLSRQTGVTGATQPTHIRRGRRSHL